MANQTNIGLCGERFCHGSEFAGGPPIIAIKESYDFSTRFRYTSVECRSLSSIYLTKEADPGSEFPDEFWGIVGRTIVHYKDFGFRRREVLLEGALNRFLDEKLVIKGVNQDCDELTWHTKSRLAPGYRLLMFYAGLPSPVPRIR